MSLVQVWVEVLVFELSSGLRDVGRLERVCVLGARLYIIGSSGSLEEQGREGVVYRG